MPRDRKATCTVIWWHRMTSQRLLTPEEEEKDTPGILGRIWWGKMGYMVCLPNPSYVHTFDSVVANRPFDIELGHFTDCGKDQSWCDPCGEVYGGELTARIRSLTSARDKIVYSIRH